MDKGVANNATYRDTYYFTDDFKVIGDEYPSINDQDKINQTIKENPYRSNVNIEGGEIVMQPDLTALFKANGKKHSAGGMDVYLRPESFIFSDYKGLAFDEADHKLMELKEGGNFNKTNNTPAQVLKRNVDVKHYNTLVNNLGDPKQDDLSKKSSSLMLEKYIQTLGNIAYLQENKKDFPDGLPYFSNGSAPVYDPAVKDNVMESKQYAKYGGNIGNPYSENPEAQLGMIYGMRRAMQQQANRATSGTVPPGGTKNTIQNPVTGETEYLPPYKPPMPGGYGTQKQLQQQLSEFNKLTGQNVPLDYQGLLQARRDVMANYPEFVQYYYKNQKTPINNSLFNRNPALKDYSMNELLNTYEDLPTGAKNPLYGNELIDYQRLNFTSQKEYDDFIKGRNPIRRGTNIVGYDDPNRRGRFYIPSLATPQTPDDCPCGIDRFGQCIPCSDPNPQQPAPNQEEIPTPNPVNGDGQGQKRADWQFTPWQKISQLYNWGQFANVKRYMPYRSRYNATYAEPSLLNPEQAVGDAKAMANQSLQALGSLNPILRNAQAAASYGQALNQIPGIRAQYDNQNSQITNQFRQYNNQVRNNESMVNMQNDQQYYQQVVTARANFDNMRTYLANQAMNNVMRDVETNQQLSYNMLTQNNPAYGFDFRSGNFYRNPKSIVDTLSIAPQETFQNMVQEVQKLKSSGLSDQVISALVRGQYFKQAAPYFQQQAAPPPFQKKGGKVKGNPYTY